MKWGFIGYGRIAKKFFEGLQHIGLPVAAIASRSSKEIPGGVTSFQSYEELLADPEVDIVYISTTHNTHAEWAIKSLQAGKHVLCEKPMSTSFKSTFDMVGAAKSSGTFLMEAIWSRYLPGYQKAIELIKEDIIGEVFQINAQFGFRMNPDDPKERLINPDLAAGALWDVGIYPISLAQDIFGDDPMTIKADAILSDLGVEDRCAIQLTYPNQGIAQLTCAINLKTHNTAVITGKKGHLIMHDFWKCEKLEIHLHDKEVEVIELPMTHNGLCHEARACSNLIQIGETQSPIMTWEHSLQLARIMDSVLLQIR